MSEIEINDIIYRYIHMMVNYKESLVIENSICEPERKINDFAKKCKMNIEGEFKILQLSLYVMNMVIQKEKYIINKKNLKLNETIIEQYIKSLANKVNNDGTFTICEKTFKNSVEFLNLIRNKFAHGLFKYDLDTNEILMVVDGKDFYFNFEWLRGYNYLFLYNMRSFLNDGVFHEIITKINPNSWEHIETFKDYKRALKEIKYIDFNVKPKKYKKYQDVELLKFSCLMTDLVNKIQNQENYTSELSKMEKLCDEYDLDFDYKIKNVIGNETSDEIRKKLYDIFHSNPFLVNSDKGFQSYFISQQVIEIICNYDNRDYFRIGLSVLTDYINYINKQKGNVSFVDYTKDNPISALHYDKMRTLIILNKFNTLFNYNMEEVYNKYFDYSQLDLKSINETINIFEDLELTKIENIQNDLIGQLKKTYIEKQRIESLLNRSVAIQLKYNKSNMKNDIDKLEKIYNEIVTKISKIEEQLLEIKKKREEYEKKFSLKPKYMQNKNAINHIRNAIGHGNFTVSRKIQDGEIIDSIITFKDIYNDIVTYEASIELNKLYDITKYGHKKIYELFGNIFMEENETVKKCLKK